MVSFKHTIPNSLRTASVRLTATLLAASAGGVLLAAAPLAATAATAGDAPTMAVNYSDLDLATESGARVLFERIQVAADEVCPAVPDIRDLNRVATHSRCMREAIARAVQQVGSPRLAAVFSAESGRG